jgi:hypothetical protein
MRSFEQNSRRQIFASFNFIFTLSCLSLFISVLTKKNLQIGVALLFFFFSLDASHSANEQRPFGVDSIQRPLLLTAEKKRTIKAEFAAKKKLDENFHSK